MKKIVAIVGMSGSGKSVITDYLEKRIIKNTSSFVVSYIKEAIEDSFKRLIKVKKSFVKN